MRTAAVALLLAGSAGSGHIAEFSPSSYTANEANAAVQVTVRRDGPNGAGTVDWATHDGSAKAGSDYVAASGTLVFADGDDAKSFTVTLKDDAAAEGAETFTVRLSNPTGVISVLGDPATVTIRAGDPTTSPSPKPTTASPRPAATTVSPRPTASRSRTPSPTPVAPPSVPVATASPSPSASRPPSTTAPAPAAAPSSLLADPAAGSGGGGFPVLPVGGLLAAAAAGWGAYALRRRRVQ